MRKVIAAILFLCGLNAARAQFTGLWSFQDFAQNPQAIRQVNLTPLWIVTPFGTNLNVGQRQIHQTATNGLLVISNMVPGAYRVDFIGGQTFAGYNTNSFTNVFALGTTGLVNAFTNLGAATNAFFAFDSRYLLRSGDTAVNQTNGSPNLATNAAAASDGWALEKSGTNLILAPIVGGVASNVYQLQVSGVGLGLGTNGFIYTLSLDADLQLWNNFTPVTYSNSLNLGTAAHSNANAFDLAGAGTTAATAATNNYPWGSFYDLAGAAPTVSNALTLPVPNTFYVETNGNDATAAPGQRSKPWLTLGAALTYANTNAPGIIYVGVGSFSAVSNIVSTNIAIIGAGINRTLIYPGNTPGHPAGLVIAGGNVSIRDLTAGVVTNYGLFTWPIQWNLGTNVTLEGLTINGNSDAVYFTVMTNLVSGLMRDCTVNFGFDGFTQNAQHSNSVFAYDRVTFNDFSDQAFSFHPDRAVLIQNSFNYFRDCTFNVTNKNTDGVDDLTDVIAVGIYNIKGQATLLSGNTFNCWWQFGVDNALGGVGNNLGQNNIMGIYANPSQTVTSYQPLDTNSIPVNDNVAPDLVGGVLRTVNPNQTLFGRGGNITGLNASQLTSGTVPTARLGSGTADSTTVLHGDNTWSAPAGGSATNAIANVYTNGILMAQGVTNINFTNMTVAPTVTNGMLTVDGTSSGGGTANPSIVMWGVQGVSVAANDNRWVLANGNSSGNLGASSLFPSDATARQMTNVVIAFTSGNGSLLGAGTNATFSLYTNTVFAGRLATMVGNTSGITNSGTTSLLLPAQCNWGIGISNSSSSQSISSFNFNISMELK